MDKATGGSRLPNDSCQREHVSAIPNYLTKDAAAMQVAGCPLSKLDYCLQLASLLQQCAARLTVSATAAVCSTSYCVSHCSSVRHVLLCQPLSSVQYVLLCHPLQQCAVRLTVSATEQCAVRLTVSATEQCAARLTVSATVAVCSTSYCVSHCSSVQYVLLCQPLQQCAARLTVSATSAVCSTSY